MITVGMNYRVREGTQKLFEEKFAAVIEALRQATGHVRSNLFRDVNDECAYLIISEWSQEKAFVEFIHSDLFKQVTDWGKDQILTARPHHKIYKN